jgi:hypothetical protein
VLKNGKRLISKHKRAEFCETKTAKPVDEQRVAEKIGAAAAAEDWVTEIRLDHVLDKLRASGCPCLITNTVDVVKAMREDVERESGGVIVWSKEIEKAVCQKAREMFVTRMKKI